MTYWVRSVNLRIVTVGLQLAIRVGVAGGLSVALAQVGGLPQPIYALIAAIIVTDPDASQTRRLGLQRVVATVIGVASGVIFSLLVQPSPWMVIPEVATAIFLCYLSPMRDGAKVAGYICGIVVIAHNDHPLAYASYRVIETILGIGVAWMISFVPPLIEIAKHDTGPKNPNNLIPRKNNLICFANPHVSASRSVSSQGRNGGS